MRTFGRLCGCWLALACCSTAMALPDLARGLAALERGDIEQAKADLVPLAEHGYVEAQIALARLHAGDPSPEIRAQAEHWLRSALTQDPSVRLKLARLLLADAPHTDPTEIDELLSQAAVDGDEAVLDLRVRLYRLYPKRFKTDEAARFAAQAAESDRPEARVEALSWYRVHVQTPKYADALAQLCRRDLDIRSECHADLARHARLSGQTGQYSAVLSQALSDAEAGALPADTIERVARVAAAEDLPGAADTSSAYALYSQIERPPLDTQVRIAKLLIADPALDPEVDPQSLLLSAVEQGSDEAAMVLGRRYLSARNPQADPVRAEALLRDAAKSEPSAHFYLGRLFERGYRGQVEPKLALDHYLRAARGGYAWADMALARMFRNNRGIKVDPVNAYAFALLANHHQIAEAPELLRELAGAMAPNQIEQATALAQREFGARRTDTGTQIAAGASSP